MRDGCDVVRLSAFLDDELDEERALAVVRHAATCSTCTGELDAVRSMRSALRSLPRVVAPPPLLFAEAAAEADLRHARRRRMLLASTGAATATSLIGLALWLAGAAGAGTVVVPMERFVADHVGRVDHGPLMTPVNFAR